MNAFKKLMIFFIRIKVGGMTFYDIKGRGRSKREPVSVGRGIMRYVPEFASRIKI